MKRINFIITMITALTVMQSCNTQDESVSSKTKVSFSLSSIDKAGRTLSADINDATAVLLSLETTGGTSVLNHQRINLLQFGGNFVTEPLELAPGTYVISDFMVVNDSSDVLFATPKVGSPLAIIVKRPLHFNFNVSSGKSVSVSMEVVPVDASMPEDFGYAAFGINVVRPLSISVFTTGNAIRLASAIAYVIKGIDTMATYALGAKVNLLSCKIKADETYKLVVIKDGYSRFTRDFVYNDLMAELNGLPLKVYLNEALSMRLRTEFKDYNPDVFGVILASLNDAHVTVDWGDGTSQMAIIQSSGYGTRIEHRFPNASASYYVTVTGEIEKITLWDSNPHEVIYSKINFEHLSELKVVNFFVGGSPILDLRQNHKIEHIVFGNKQLFLPDHHNLKIVVIFGKSLAPYLDSIIDNVYKNAIAENIREGVFQYSENPDSDTEIGLGTPSTTALSQLENLYYTYQWSIYPMI